jgi:hypothetical protein
MRAARLAQSQAEQSVQGTAPQVNVKKRLMIAAFTKVIRLERSGRRITRVVTNRGDVDVPDGGKVFLGLGTIENTRQALLALPNARGLIGRNLMAHLRSNVTIRVPRTSLPPLPSELQTSALFVKGIYMHADGSPGHFHIQITASGVGNLETNSEAELFKKIPDIDTLDRFADLTDPWVVITLRGIGEMVGDRTSPDPQNRIILDRLGPQGDYDYGQPRALVRLEAGPSGSKDLLLWAAMDRATDELAVMFGGGGGPVQYLVGGTWQDTPPGPTQRWDKLGSTHHEGGTLWMGDDATASVTDEFGRFHEADNLYAVGPCLLPTLGSPNPMLSGVALTRRIANHVLQAPPIPAPETGFVYLFDGTEKTFNGWLFAGRVAFALIDGTLVAQPSSDLGLLYYALDRFGDFTLRLQFRLDRVDDNSGVFVRSRDPRRRVPDRTDPKITYAYDNQAWVAVHTGFEVQIDEFARPNNLDKHRTGAIYDIPTGQGGEQRLQNYQRGPSLQAGQWNDCEINVAADTYTVRLGGQVVTTFTNQDSYRGKSPSQDSHSGFIGLQAHTGRVAFRNIRIRVAGAPMPMFAAVRAAPAPAAEIESSADSDY